jgi:hypothetical protein
MYLIMKKLIFLLAVLLTCGYAVARENEGWHNAIELQSDFAVSGGYDSFRLNYVGTKSLSEAFALGVVAGAHQDWKFNETPHLYIETRGEFDFTSGEKFMPFVSMDLGFSISFEKHGFEETPLMLNPTFGTYIDKFYIGVGYVATIGLKQDYTCHGVAVKVGYNF